MKPPPVKKGRAPVEKQHYWLQIDFEVRAESLEVAIQRLSKLFRRTVRTKLREGLVYMGAHSATVRGSLKAPRTMHPTVVVKKDLPSKPGVSLQVLDDEAAARAATKAARKKKQEFVMPEGGLVASMSVPAVPGQPVGRFVGNLDKEGKLTVRPKPKGGMSLAALMGDDE